MVQLKQSTGWLVAAVAAMTLLATTGIWNPFPAIGDWLTTSRPLSDPALTWQERLGGAPKSVTIVDRVVVVEQRESVEARSRATGKRLWEAKSDWATVAGPAQHPVVVSGILLKKGYEVRDPVTGLVLRRDDKASAVWSFANALLEVWCGTPKDCDLTAREPETGDEIWRTALPGIGFVLFADNPKLAMGAAIEPEGIEVGARPPAMPSLLGFPIDGRVYAVDTAEGRTFPAINPGRNTSVTVLAGRVIFSIATPREGICQVTLSGRDALTGVEAWHRDGYQLKTISGAGCDQRKEPVAGGNAVVAVRPDGREALLDAADGREVLTCAAGEKILATDGVHAVVRSADGLTVSSFLLGKPKALWTRKADPKASAGVTRNAVIISQHSPDRILVLDPDTGKVRNDIRSGAAVVAADAKGLLLGDRRELGYLPFG
jgi:outer membrane protein assembly factor BamB